MGIHVGAVLRLFPVLGRLPTYQAAIANAPMDNEEPFVLERCAIAGIKDLLYRLAERPRV